MTRGHIALNSTIQQHRRIHRATQIIGWSMSGSVQRAWRRAGWRRRAAALAALAALLACVRAPAPALVARASFPHAHAAALAHLLADFSTHPHASRPWLVEQERGNYTDWSYRVSFECGARCTGVASVRAASAGASAPSHGRAPRHTVRLDLTACSQLPLLPWPKICDEMEVEWRVYGEGEGGAARGCVVEESARAWCGALRVLSGACSRDLRAHRSRHLERLRAALTPAGGGAGATLS